jgi:hypothetical protein
VTLSQRIHWYLDDRDQFGAVLAKPEASPEPPQLSEGRGGRRGSRRGRWSQRTRWRRLGGLKAESSRVRGAAVAGKATEESRVAAGIESRTVHGLEHGCLAAGAFAELLCDMAVVAARRSNPTAHRLSLD